MGVERFVMRCINVCVLCASCVHPVAVLNAASCMTCSLLMLVEDAIVAHKEEAYSRAGLIRDNRCMYMAHVCFLCLL